MIPSPITRWLTAFFVLFVLGLLQSAGSARAQAVSQVVLVEHFTNTRCSICFNRNPGFYANLRQQPTGTLHIAYHPSSPYRLCQFSQQNPTENDARTNFYGIYGSTPRLVVNGQVIPSGQNYADPAVFAPAQGQVSPLAVQVALTRLGADSLAATVEIRTVAAHTLTGTTLYVALAEDTVFYAAPNGETRHYDVFRQAFTGAAPLAFVPAPVGSAVTVRRTVAVRPDWAVPRLYALAMVQQPGGRMVQAGASAVLGTTPLGLTASIETLTSAAEIYPNPAHHLLTIRRANGSLPATATLLDGLGRAIRQWPLSGADEQVSLSGVVPGTYVVRIQAGGGVVEHRRIGVQ